MLFTEKSPAEKRKAFHDGLASGKLLQFPGAFNPLCAQMIERKGFDGVYISGAVMSADLCLPDIGIATMTEFVDRGQQIARVGNPAFRGVRCREVEGRLPEPSPEGGEPGGPPPTRHPCRESHHDDVIVSQSPQPNRSRRIALDGVPVDLDACPTAALSWR